MHSCTHISNIIKKQPERRKNSLMKGNTRIIRAKNEYANIKWCENMMATWGVGLSQVYCVEKQQQQKKKSKRRRKMLVTKECNAYSESAHGWNMWEWKTSRSKMIKNDEGKEVLIFRNTNRHWWGMIWGKGYIVAHCWKVRKLFL